jgi:cytoskeletal protein CcmA (bactofilin family)
MALWKEAPAGGHRDATGLGKDVQGLAKEPPGIAKSETVLTPGPSPASDFAPQPSSPPRRAAPRETSETVIGSQITIVGRIDGMGNVRIAGRFEGDVNIEGDLIVDAGAKLTGSVRASAVALGGELEGNIESASRVELLATGVLNGDLKAGTLMVAAGSKMRGRVEFGFSEETPAKTQLTLGSRQAS